MDEANLRAPTSPLLSTTPSAPAASDHIRFADVVDEIKAIAELCARAQHPDGSPLATACRKVEALLMRLRAQFLDDLLAEPPVLGPQAAGGDVPSRPAA